MMTLGQKIKELRIKNNETQDDLAKLLTISNQSISKWERDIGEPSIDFLKAIANHYNVSMDYITFNDYNNTIELDAVLNKKDDFMVWTDFEYLDTIAPESSLSKDRRTPGKWFLPTHPAPKDYLVIGVDDKNEICFLGMHYNHPFPSCGPIGMFYSKFDGIGEKNPCFIIKDSYSLNYYHRKDFEFVIPKNGFIITLPYNNLKTRTLFSELLPQRLKQFVIANYNDLFKDTYYYDWNKNFFNLETLPDELNSIKVLLNNNIVQFIIPKEDTKEINDSINTLMLDNTLLRKKIYNLESRLDDLESANSIIDELEERINKLENKK